MVLVEVRKLCVVWTWKTFTASQLLTTSSTGDTGRGCVCLLDVHDDSAVTPRVKTASSHKVGGVQASAAFEGPTVATVRGPNSHGNAKTRVDGTELHFVREWQTGTASRAPIFTSIVGPSLRTDLL